MKLPPHDAAREKLARGLSGLLADTYMLYNTTQVCHWNVEGPGFAALHDLFEVQYREMAEAIDDIAERVRALGYYAPGRLHDVLENSRLGQRARPAEAVAMLDHLIEGHELVAHRLRELAGLADSAMDEASQDLAVGRLRAHEKMLWMLASQAGRPSLHLGGRADAGRRNGPSYSTDSTTKED
jgi:starvation-inducible DNA-binding protein